MKDLRVFLYENFVDVASEGIDKAREAKMDEADISAAILVEYLLGGASVAIVNQISLTEFLLLAKDSYSRMVEETKKFIEDQKVNEAKAEVTTTAVPYDEVMREAPNATVIPFAPKKTLH